MKWVLITFRRENLNELRMFGNFGYDRLGSVNPDLDRSQPRMRVNLNFPAKMCRTLFHDNQSSSFGEEKLETYFSYSKIYKKPVKLESFWNNIKYFTKLSKS